MKGVIDRIWSSLKFGETVLIEHDPHTSPALGVYHLVKWAKEKGYNVLVDDILDTLYVYKAHLKLAGLDPDILSDVKVIKLGGRLNVGQVVGHLHIKEPIIRESEYRTLLDSLSKERVINPVLGFEKLFLLVESERELFELVNSIFSFIDDERRIAFYFINTDLLKKKSHVLSLLEELATTVVRVTKHGKSFSMKVVRSVNDEIDGVE
ncbi:DUF257 family protein [Thermococcus paralvinellae]|uniref:KaiC-like domain-containing protein n=1 Tax=Thermococcus paralvinellae TaxID=582419 RepID=W0I4S5_9EURY|nr:DUF257 family protein [Thermococcus paralvinellae]AHF81111.1 Hypothetical protein TES1_1736 [Thermococcus paralvinellae]